MKHNKSVMVNDKRVTVNTKLQINNIKTYHDYERIRSKRHACK